MNKPITAMPKYAEYKDSGVDWLGEIPAGWEVEKAKWIWREIEERSQSGTETLLSVSQYKGVTPRRGDSRSEDLSGYKSVYKNHLVTNIMLAWMGGLGISNFDGIVSPAYSVYQLKLDAIPRFLGYLYRTNTFLAEFARRSTGVVPSRWRMYTDDFGQVFTILPPLPEQTAIAKFLDDKVVRIEALVGIKRRQIELLAERKQILIQNAVTQGLNPDVPMKDSGIDWIGEIPAHWEVTKLRYLGTFQNGISAGAEYFGSGFPFVTYGDVYNNSVLPSKPSGLAKSSTADRINYSIQEGDVLFTRTSEVATDIGISSTCLQAIENASFSGFVIRMRPATNFLRPEYSSYLFRCIYISTFFAHEMNIVIRASLGQELLKNLPIFLPSLNEQEEIVSYCALESKKINIAITLKQNQIEKLTEYKTTLINAAVTGKIKVVGE